MHSKFSHSTNIVPNSEDTNKDEIKTVLCSKFEVWSFQIAFVNKHRLKTKSFYTWISASRFSKWHYSPDIPDLTQKWIESTVTRFVSLLVYNFNLNLKQLVIPHIVFLALILFVNNLQIQSWHLSLLITKFFTSFLSFSWQENVFHN